MLGSGKKHKTTSGKVDTIIGQQTRIEGDVHFTGGLHVDGHIKGGIVAEAGSDSVLTVSEHGSIEGDVRVPTVILNGTVTGDVRSGDRIELSTKAEVNGDVYYNLIEMAMGAAVNGSLVHEVDKPSAVVSFERENVENSQD
ncbi:MAG: polymer-forming cytoskeletal protein [Gammaproteobacteria bacterium]|nr:polymer-forming cytoskeletal protein [Gammaproteobacteria bacterium]MDH5515502.1 polymer-forming cytoskeletal protein [Gammaproteobacteria bacterium]